MMTAVNDIFLQKRLSTLTSVSQASHDYFKNVFKPYGDLMFDVYVPSQSIIQNDTYHTSKFNSLNRSILIKHLHILLEFSTIFLTWLMLEP